MWLYSRSISYFLIFEENFHKFFQHCTLYSPVHYTLKERQGFKWFTPSNVFHFSLQLDISLYSENNRRRFDLLSKFSKLNMRFLTVYSKIQTIRGKLSCTLHQVNIFCICPGNYCFYVCLQTVLFFAVVAVCLKYLCLKYIHL